jgi:hypothetical protein
MDFMRGVTAGDSVTGMVSGRRKKKGDVAWQVGPTRQRGRRE